MRQGKIFLLCIFLFGLFFSQRLVASHMRAADIKAEQVCGTYTYKITITAYLNSLSNTKFGDHGMISFGDGQSVNMSAVNSTVRPDLGTNISIASYTVTHTFASAGTYTITYLEDHRNVGVLNIANSGQVAYVSYLTIVIDPALGCNNLPLLTIPPVDGGCSGATFFHNPGAFDSDGDSLSYEMSIPAIGITTSADYTSPTSSAFYNAGTYNTSNETGDGPPTLSINSLTGLVTWDAPGLIGEYNIAFKIIEWRKNSAGVYRVISSTTRDMQIVVEDCLNTRPDVSVPNDTCVVAGTALDKIIKGTDREDDPVKIEVYSEILELESPATYTPNPAVFVPSEPAAELNLRWNTTCTHVRQQPYQVVFKITDNPSTGQSLATYRTWNITIVAPAPVWKNTQIDLVNRYGILEWENYTCPNASKIQVWRKVGSYDYTPGYCSTGIPSYSGYQLVGLVDAGDTVFTDTNFGMGLAAGAKYCYRLVALVADAKSYVSEESCIGPIQADAPVITHVSVIKTDVSGSIRVSWRSPFNINEEQFPKPYEYEIYRANDFIGENGLVKTSDHLRDTTFLDEGINTTDSVFNYRIVLYAKPRLADVFIPVDTSAVASSVRLSVAAGINQMTLAWRDSVPWSNVVQARPYHLIYRGKGIVPEEELEFLDSVNVSINGFRYTDQDVDNNQIYTYRVLTRGSYGNPAIAIQENLSQIISLYPENDLLPCPPILTIDKTDCNAYTATDVTCTLGELSNTISWSSSLSTSCRIDITAYRIYVSSTLTGEYELLATVTDTFYVDKGLSSYARCYKVSAVDTQGNEGPLTESICNDNCPYYELPNVFTPNDDGCNDVFSAYFNDAAAESGTTCATVDESRCPRFVKSVTFRVINRWGIEVYYFSSGDLLDIYIDWDGRDTNGSELATGVYYYSAEVEFDVLDEANKNRTIKSWVHLIR